MSTTLIKFARFFASVKHRDQFYSGGLPYTHHLAAVEAVLREFGFTQEVILAASWLHDVVEDQPVKLKDIEELFGDDVAKLVGAVTNEPGENRKVRAAMTYPKIRRAGHLAVALKLADRIANLRTGGKLVEMYRKEYPDFRHGLHISHLAGDQVVIMRVDKMWAWLDKWYAEEEV